MNRLLLETRLVNPPGEEEEEEEESGVLRALMGGRGRRTADRRDDDGRCDGALDRCPLPHASLPHAAILLVPSCHLPHYSDYLPCTIRATREGHPKGIAITHSMP